MWTEDGDTRERFTNNDKQTTTAIGLWARSTLVENDVCFFSPRRNVNGESSTCACVSLCVYISADGSSGISSDVTKGRANSAGRCEESLQ